MKSTAYLLAMMAMVFVACEETGETPKPPPPTQDVCELPLEGAACVTVSATIYPITAQTCTMLSKVPYFCRQEPSEATCQKTERDGMWCCCDASTPGCASMSGPKDEKSDCQDGPSGAVCSVLDVSVYPEYATGCSSIDQSTIPYFCTSEPSEPTCKPLEKLDAGLAPIWCCCDPLKDMFCEAHLAPAPEP